MYGPYDNFDPDNSHVIPALMLKCYKAKKNETPFQVFGTGNPLRQFLYSVDGGRLILRLLLLENFAAVAEMPSIILASGPEGEHTIRQAAEAVAAAFGFVGEIVFDPKASDGVMKKTASNARLMKLFPDFRFTPLAEGLELATQWFLQQAAAGPEGELRLGSATLQDVGRK
eukprot:GHVU01075101.1.p2 GENE.GHVU01075101.1~~GHVU01075101.1.p2  ORF type:complete len:171 (+),score=25.53 GHVU01075101.1:541-1053(+)